MKRYGSGTIDSSAFTPVQTDSSGLTGYESSNQGILRNPSTISSAIEIKANENACLVGPITIGMPDTVYTVTVVSSEFIIDGETKPILNLHKGVTYTFNQTDALNDGHPFAFRNSSDASYTTGVTYQLNGSSATQSNYYNVTTFNAGRTSGDRKLIFVVPSDAPSTLKYYCTVHGNGMGNTINVLSDGASLTVSGQLQII